MKSNPKTPWRNHAPHGWWIASYLQRFEWQGAKPATRRSRPLCWENTVILKAKDREIAFRKAIALANSSATGKWQLLDDPPGHLGRWIFEGLTRLVPIYDSLEDGAEVLWQEYTHKSLGSLRQRVRPKAKLEAFNW